MMSLIVSWMQVCVWRREFSTGSYPAFTAASTSICVRNTCWTVNHSSSCHFKRNWRYFDISKIHFCLCFLTEGWGKPVWGPNVHEFRQRFDPAETKGEGTRRLKNLYFLYLIELRALSKVAPYFERSFINLYTGNTQEDSTTKDLLLDILNETKWDMHIISTSYVWRIIYSDDNTMMLIYIPWYLHQYFRVQDGIIFLLW